MGDLPIPKQKWRKSVLWGGNTGTWGEELGGDEGGETVLGKIKILTLSESCGTCTYYSVDSSCFPHNSALIKEL